MDKEGYSHSTQGRGQPETRIQNTSLCTLRLVWDTLGQIRLSHVSLLSVCRETGKQYGKLQIRQQQTHL